MKIETIKKADGNKIGFVTAFTKIWGFLSRKRKSQVSALFFGMIVGGFLEIANIGILVPFLGFLASPGEASKYEWLNSFVPFEINLGSQSTVLMYLTISLCVFVLLASGFRGVMQWLSIRLSYAIGNDFEVEVFRRSLYQPYSVHVSQNSSVVISGIEKTNSLTGSLLAYLSIMHSAVTILMLVSVFLIASPVISSSIFLIICMAYLLASYLVRQVLEVHGEKVTVSLNTRLKLLQEGLGGIRDILLSGLQRYYYGNFNSVNMQMKRSQALIRFVALVPRLIIEPVGIITIAISALVLSLREGFAETVIILGVVALTVQRLLPMTQQAFGGWTAIMSSIPSVKDVFMLLDRTIPEFHCGPTKVFDFNHVIKFDQLSFHYNNGQDVLKDIDFSINKGQYIGLMGKTGSGKSTILDLFLGLLTPTEGRILVDGREIDENNRREWQQAIAHVPQEVYLTDATIAENIAFGEKLEEIDNEKLYNAVKLAQLAGFIDYAENGYNTIVGERGVQLSGGQRQRIGMARAIYRGASILVLDEATSALDENTEKQILQSIVGLGKGVTILMVTHRTSTLHHCDMVFEIISGKVKKV